MGFPFTKPKQDKVVEVAVEKKTSRSGRTRFLLATSAAVLSGVFLFSAYMFTFAPVKVVVAAKDFLPGETITADGLEAKTIPRGAAEPGAVTSVEALAGKTAGVHIFQGQQILTRMLGDVSAIDANKTILSLERPSSAAAFGRATRNGGGGSAGRPADAGGGPGIFGQIRPGKHDLSLSIPKADAARMAYAVSSASKVYLFPNF
jgi:Flagellar basal body P-ring biosynthesis protein